MKKSLEAIVDDLIENIEEEEGVKKCVFCPKGFKATHNLKKHVIKHHKTSVPHQWISDEDVKKECV